jgi:hypothetical protein
VVAQVVGEAMRGNVGACVQLIRDSLSSAEVDTRLDDEGSTLLRKACEYGSAEVVRELLAKGARVSEMPLLDSQAPAIPSSKGLHSKDTNNSKHSARRPSCLEIACSKSNNEELVRLLAPHASDADRLECLRTVLANPTAPSSSDGSASDSNNNSSSSVDGALGPGSLPRDEATVTRLAACLLLLSPESKEEGQRGAVGPTGERERANQTFNSSQSSVLHDAVNRGLNGVVELLLSHGFAEDLLTFDKDGLSPLHLAEKRHVLSLLQETMREKEERRRRSAQSELQGTDRGPRQGRWGDNEGEEDNGGWSLFMEDEELFEGSSDAYASEDELSHEPINDDEDDFEDDGSGDHEEDEDEAEGGAGSSRWGKSMLDATSVMFLRSLEGDLKRSRGEVALGDTAVAVFERTILLLYRAMGVRSALFSEFGLQQIESKLLILADYGVPRLLDDLAGPFNTAPWPTVTSSSDSNSMSIGPRGETENAVGKHDTDTISSKKRPQNSDDNDGKIDIEAVIKDASKSRNRRLTPPSNAPDAHQHLSQDAEDAIVELGFVNNNAASRDFMDMLNLVAELRRSVDAPSSMAHIKARRAQLYYDAMREPPRGVRGAAAKTYAVDHPEEVQLLSERAVRAIIWCLSSPCEDLDASAIMEWAFILQNYTDIYTPVHCLSVDIQQYYERIAAQKEGKKTKTSNRGRKSKVVAASEELPGAEVPGGNHDWSAEADEVARAVASNPGGFYSCRLVMDAAADPLRGLCHPAVAAQMLDNIGELGYMILLGITGQVHF